MLEKINNNYSADSQYIDIELPLTTHPEVVSAKRLSHFSF